jgi:uncharacterized protein (TIGR02001 family)
MAMKPCKDFPASMKQTLFRAREARAPLLALSAAIAALAMPIADAGAADFSGNAALTSDYVWRGSTQALGDPAAQLGFKLAGDSGFYASAWGSNVHFAPGTGANLELDLSAGWAKALSDDWALDVNVLHYGYPHSTIDLDWTELNGTLTWKGNYWASVGVSNEALGYDASGTYLLLGAKWPVNDRFRFETTAAHYFLDEGTVGRSGYTHGMASAVYAFTKPGANATVEGRLTLHATDNDAKAIFGAGNAGSRVEAALQAAF